MDGKKFENKYNYEQDKINFEKKNGKGVKFAMSQERFEEYVPNWFRK